MLAIAQIIALFLALAPWPARNTYAPAVRAQIDAFDAGFTARRSGLPRNDPREDWQTGWEMGGWSLTSGLEGLYETPERLAKRHAVLCN